VNQKRQCFKFSTVLGWLSNGVDDDRSMMGVVGMYKNNRGMGYGVVFLFSLNLHGKVTY
jgi:hypothetical protein